MRRPLASRLVMILLLLVQGGWPVTVRAAGGCGAPRACCDAACPMHLASAAHATCSMCSAGGAACRGKAAAATPAHAGCPMHDAAIGSAPRAPGCQLRCGACGGAHAPNTGVSVSEPYLSCAGAVAAPPAHSGRMRAARPHRIAALAAAPAPPPPRI